MVLKRKNTGSIHHVKQAVDKVWHGPLAKIKTSLADILLQILT